MFSHVKQYDKNHVSEVTYSGTGEWISDKWLEKIEQSIGIVKYYVQKIYESNYVEIMVHVKLTN